MLNNTALAQLKDIHLSPPMGWWPLAPGWYVLASLGLIGLLIFLFVVIRYFYFRRGKRKALQVLEQYRMDYLKHRNSQLTAARLSELLKRVALMYYSRGQVASLNGQLWVDFLNRTSRGLDFNSVKTLITDVPYQPPHSCEVLPLFPLAKSWIKQRRGRCLH